MPTPKKADINIDIMQARLPKGTLKRMDKVLKGGEIRSHFLRNAVENELRHREAALKRRRQREPEPIEQERTLTAAE